MPGKAWALQLSLLELAWQIQAPSKQWLVCTKLPLESLTT